MLAGAYRPVMGDGYGRVKFGTGEVCRFEPLLYEDNMELDDIAASVADAKTLLGELEVLRQRAARAPVIRTREQRNRWRRLTGELRPLEA